MLEFNFYLFNFFLLWPVQQNLQIIKNDKSN